MATTIKSWVLAISALLGASAATGFVVKLYLDPPVCVVAPQPNAKKK